MRISFLDVSRVIIGSFLFVSFSLNAEATVKFLGQESDRANKIKEEINKRIAINHTDLNSVICIAIGGASSFSECDEVYWFLAPTNSKLDKKGFILFDSPDPKSISEAIEKIRRKPRVGIIYDENELEFANSLSDLMNSAGGKLIKINYKGDIGKALLDVENSSIEMLLVQTSGIFSGNNIRQLLESLGRKQIIVLSTIRGAEKIGAAVVASESVESALDQFVEIINKRNFEKRSYYLNSPKTTINKGLAELYNITSVDGEKK